MKIEIDLKIILLLILFILLNKIELYTIFIIFIFIHEIAHMIVGMMVGFVPKTLSLNPLGVSIEFYNYDKKKKSLKRIITYLAGPAVNFIFAIFISKIDFYYILKFKVVYTNLLLGIFNLFPILPLDGGKIFKEILLNIVGNKKANIFMINTTKIVLVIFSFIYSIAIFKVKNIAVFLIIVYLWYLYYVEYKKSKILIRVYESINKNDT